MEKEDEVCRFCGSYYRVSGGVCDYCARGWDFGLDEEIQEELDTIERPTSQGLVGGEC